ncbi:MAG: cysteine dioxygenase family protein [Flavobacteriales bacterium]|nr:cysteine dioxygenase family protein [Flavobacteriales bacterium]
MSSLPKITTLKQFINILYQGTGYESYANLLQSIDFGAKEVEPLCFWNPEEYSRISIDKGDSFELVLMCWEPEQSTPIHNHNLLEGWIYVIDGQLTEESFIPANGKTTTLKGKEVINSGDVSYINDELGVHRVTNSHKGRTISLHLYSGSIGEVNTYEEGTRNIEKITLHHD